MNKAAIKNFAIWARNKLISDVEYKAGLMGVTEDGIQNPLPQSTGQTQFFDIGTAEPYAITGEQIRQRKNLVDTIKAKEKQTDYATAYKYIIEGVAYTWFNRLIAIRFMEVNDYLPSHVRVLSSEGGKTEPDLVTSPFDADLSFTDSEKQEIINLKNANKLDECFRMLFIKQCNALNANLPALFEKTADYTEALLNISAIDKEGVVYHLVNDIPEDDFNIEKGGQVEIIGWLYQYYNTEPKNETFAKSGKITKEEIPAVTQLFTPDWIVRYMVENSLGRLWVEGHPNDSLKAGWKYYLEEAEQEPEVQAQLDEIHKEYSKLNPEDIKFIDPCMGSGHILVYAFDVLMQIYESAGWSERDAAKSILENNIYGLDIDDRAYQMAYFAVMMKARQYNRRILSADTPCHVYSIQESNGIDRKHLQYLGNELSDSEKKTAIEQLTGLLDTFRDAKEYGSILNVEDYDWDLLRLFVSGNADDGQISLETVGINITQESLEELIDIGQVMATKYEVVVTNPPYAAVSGLGKNVNDYVKNKYKRTKSDLFAVFIEKCEYLLEKRGYLGMITPEAWMFLGTFLKLRTEVLFDSQIISLLHLGLGAFECGFGTTSFVLSKYTSKKRKGLFIDLREYKDETEKKIGFFEKNITYSNSLYDMKNLPNAVLAYWCSKEFKNLFKEYGRISDSFNLECGIKNGNNEFFLRGWFEVYYPRINISNSRSESMTNMESGGKKWFKCNKGGGYKKWYGNYEYVINLENDARDIKKMISSSTYRLRKKENYFRNTITWPLVSGNRYSCRFMSQDILPDVNANIIIIKSDIEYILMGYMNSKLFDSIIKMLNPTLAFPIETIGNAPCLIVDKPIITERVKENIKISKYDYDNSEVSWDFNIHPLTKGETIGRLISDKYKEWEKECEDRFNQLKANEEELNRIFIDIYGLQDELSPEVEDKDVTVRKAELQRDIKSLLSYAVGCMFGRYSLDVEGLAYAGGEWDASKYSTFIPDDDNIIPITDEEYFEDDIVGLLCGWLKKVYGEDTLEQNLDFIASALKNKGDTSRDIIRNYFVNDFFKDHCKTYSVTGSGKRPIYWLFDSGKQNGFKALIYLHRYNADTIGNLRVDYLHRMQRVYESEIGRMQDMIDHSTNSREVGAATKRKEKLQKQLKECRDYDEKIGHLALTRTELDLDDGVKYNYRKVQLGSDGKFYEVLADSKAIMMPEKKFEEFKK